MKENEMTEEQKIALVKKWSCTGLLREVKDVHLFTVVIRLERAAKRALKTKDGKPLEDEILRMRAEGLFNK